MATPFVSFGKEAIEQSITERFEEQVFLHPDRLAVKTQTESLTYAALNERANGVAAELLAARPAPHEPVVLLLEAGAWQIATIMGVLMAGKLYVPLDPGYPFARLAYMLEDSQAPLLITDRAQSGLAADLATREQQVICLDEMVAADFSRRPDEPVSPEAPAYVFYTSGSTGPPKGVVDCHRNVLHNIMRYTNALHIHAGDRLTLLQSCSFSGSVSSLFCALLNGACLYQYDVQRHGTGPLAGWVNGEEITVYHSVPALFRQLFQGEEQFPHLRVVRLEGDQASVRDVELFRERLGPLCVLANGLGATETGLVRQYRIRRDTVLPGATVPIGYPLPDMEVLLVGAEGKEVEAGQVGEIVVRSRYLALGYWRRPDLTEAAFSPATEHGAERSYRTGDLGRMHPDGCMEYLGRKDLQPKIRGQRIEIESIEAALLGLESVREAVAQVREDPPEEPRLVAYIVPSGQPAPTVSALRRRLQSALPEAMLPSRFILLNALPLNENGKLDRLALPPPDACRPVLDTPFVAPCTPVEAWLVEIWSEVLGMQGVGVHDSFFELGGHSLLVTQVLARVRAAFQVEVSITGFFAEPTVAGLQQAVVGGLLTTVLPPDYMGALTVLEGLIDDGE
jgi:amino acid adenylation domain-containing protein